MFENNSPRPVAVRKVAVRFIVAGRSRTYVLLASGTCDGICTALDLLEADLPAMSDNAGLAVIAKTYPEGAALALEGDGPFIDLTRQPVCELEAA